MICGCNSTPCNCLPQPSVCCTPTTESVAYTFENANLVGIGFFDNETDYLVQFRGLVSNSLALTVTLDAGNNVIALDFDSALLVADIPDADTTTRGILETATNAEALAKAATDKILVPSNLAALGSTTSFAGLVELATDAETIAGASSTLAVTPAGLAAASVTFAPTTFADAATRAGATPDFVGQIGTQEDDYSMWVGSALAAGSWNRVFTDGVVNQLANGTGTVFEATTGGLEFRGTIEFDTAVLNIGGSTFNFFNASTLQISTDAFMDVRAALNQFKITGVSVPANSVLGTSANAGEMTSRLLNTFVSTANTQTGYTAFSNPATLRTCDTATVTLSQLAQIVGTLIEDLKAVKLPAT